MAQEKDQLLIEVIVDIPDVKKKAEDTRQALANLRLEQEKTQKAFDNKLLGTDTYKKVMSALTVEIDKGEKELATYTKALGDQEKTQKSVEATTKQMVTSMTTQTSATRGLNTAQQQSSKSNQQLGSQIKTLSNEFTTNRAAIGDNRQLVFAYTQSIEQAITGDTTWSNQLHTTANSLVETKQGITNYVQGLRATTEGMGSAQKASLALGLGLKAIGIGLLITAITAVIGFLSRMDAGMDRIEQATAALSAGFEAFIQTIAPIGELIVDTFEHPIDAIVKFGQALAHPIDTFLKLKDGSVTMANEVATNVGKATAAAVAYTKAMQDIQDEQDGLIGQQALVSKQVQLAEKASKDRSKSERERLDLLDAAGKAETALSDKVVALKKRELVALQTAQKGKKALQDADRLAEQKSIAALADAESAAANTQQTIQNRRAALLEQEAAEVKKAADQAKEAARKQAQDRVYEAETAVLQLQKNGQTSPAIEQELLNRRITLIKKQGDLEKVGLAKNAAQRKLIDAKTNQDILDATQAFATRVSDVTFAIQEGRLSAQLALVQKGSQQEYALQQQALTTKLDREKAAAVDTIKNQQQLTAELRRLGAQYNADTENLGQAFDTAQVQRAKDLANDRLQTEQDLSLNVLADTRKIAADRIDLEEKTQIDLLDIEKKYGRLTDADYLVRLNAVQAKAIAARKQPAKTQRDDARNEAKADADIALAQSKEGSSAELAAKITQLHIQRDAELDNTTLTEKEKAAIRAKYARDEDDLKKKKRDEDIDKAKDTVLQITGTLSNIFQAQAALTAKVIDDQETSALKSAGLSADAREKIQAKYDEKRAAAEKKAAEQRRKIAEVEAIISTAAAVIKASPNIFLMALAGVTGLAQLAVIESQQFEHGGEIKLARGGEIVGPSHAQGGVKYRFGNRIVELEGGEGVINKRSMAMPGVREQASRLNQLGGGVPFTSPRTYSPPIRSMLRMADGGVVNYALGQSAQSGIDYQKLAQAMAQLPPSIVQVRDIQNGVARRVWVENKADS